MTKVKTTSKGWNKMVDQSWNNSSKPRTGNWSAKQADKQIIEGKRKQRKFKVGDIRNYKIGDFVARYLPSSNGDHSYIEDKMKLIGLEDNLFVVEHKLLGKTIKSVFNFREWGQGWTYYPKLTSPKAKSTRQHPHGSKIGSSVGSPLKGVDVNCTPPRTVGDEVRLWELRTVVILLQWALFGAIVILYALSRI